MESMDATSSAQKSTELTPASIPSTLEVPPSPSSNLNPNPNSISNSNQNPQSSAPLQQQQQQQQQQQPTLQHSHTRPPINRPWPQPPFSQFSPLPSSSSASLMPSSSLPASSSISTTPFQRGGLAIGVPAHHVRPSQQSTPFSSFGASHFNQQYGGLAQNSVGVPDPLANSTSTQVRQPIQGIQSMGVMGSLGSRRPGGVSSQQQQRPIHSLVRSQSPSTNPSLATQKFQGHGLIRAPSVSSPGSPSPGTPQSLQSHPQTWMSTGSQGKQMHPSLSSPLYRSQMKPESLQQRSHIPQQHQLSTASHQQQMTSAQQQQQPSRSHQSQEHYGQQYPRPRAPHSVSHQQHVTQGQGSGYQKFPSLAQPSTIQPGPHNAAASADAGECSGQILGKRSIHELVSQIDPCEKLDPEVEDILVELADEFIDSITTFGCLLAKHRKSATLEAKDILLHLERNWNMTFPGFGGDEIKIYKKPSANDIHKERIAAIKKSVIGIEAANSKSSVGQAGGNVKGHTAKAPTTGSPKSRQVP